MKKFQITVTDGRTGTVLETDEMHHRNKGHVENFYKAKYRFHTHTVKVHVEQIQRKPGVQIDLIDMIKDIENERTTRNNNP